MVSMFVLDGGNMSSRKESKFTVKSVRTTNMSSSVVSSEIKYINKIYTENDTKVVFEFDLQMVTTLKTKISFSVYILDSACIAFSSSSTILTSSLSEISLTICVSPTVRQIN